MLLTDTHTHLYYQTDEQEREQLIKRCSENAIGRLFLPNVDTASIPMLLSLASAFPTQCYPMMGLHPCSVKENWEDELADIKQAASGQPIFAVGEIGIDLYWDKSHLAAQVEAFRNQITWAKQLQLPIVIHCRDAFDEVYEILQQEQGDGLRGIFHCFTGTLEQAYKITALGFYLGIGGVVTYKNAGLDKIVAQIDLRHLVLETDSPYLTPVPYRGKPNESSYLIYIAQKVAELHHTSIENVAAVTTENSRLVFGI